MGYLHIDNLYRSQDILLFRECYALEKIHGTSAHVGWSRAEPLGLRLFPGGESYERFKGLFDIAGLAAKFATLGHAEVIVYGEAYGGSQQGMSATYGKVLKFIAFDVQIGGVWLSVPNAAQVVGEMGLEFVSYERCSTELATLDRWRDAPSVQAQRNGCGGDKKREGVVLRPLIELTKSNGDRLIAKHKADEFKERATPQKVVDPATLKVLGDASAIAAEWVTETRLSHVLDHLRAQGIDLDFKNLKQITSAMVEDVNREAKGEIVGSPEANKAIGRRTAELCRVRIKGSLVTKHASLGSTG